ncbi:MAG: replicative DNA helicase [Thermoanaerobaculia bacterium]
MSLAPVGISLDEPLPHNTEAERAVLGAIIINNNAFYRVIGTVDSDSFFKDHHRKIFAAMRVLAEESRPIDLLTLTGQLVRSGALKDIGGSAYLSSLVDVVPDIANVEWYAELVKETANKRRLIVMGNSVMRAAADVTNTSSEVLTIAEKSLYDIAEGATDKGFVSLGAITRTNMGAIEQMHSNAGRLVTGLPTGYDRFNEMTSGFQPQDLIILAARPSMGKTSLMMNIAESIALPGKDGLPRNGGDRLYGVGVFSLEMSKEQIGLRILSSESGVSNHLIRSGMLSARNWRELADAASRLAKGKIYIDDSPGMDPLEMRAKARRLKMEAGLDMIMVDYLQLMSVKGKIESRQQEISQISRGLKAIAKELNVPLLSLSQLSRRPEQRTGDHRPQLSDLRESGSIEQDADLVAFIYRDEVYNKETEEKGIAEIIIAKQRNGPIGTIRLTFMGEHTRFENFASPGSY